MKYVIYVRKSSDKNSWRQTKSIPDQIEKCIEYAKINNLEIAKKPEDFSLFESEAEIQAEDQTSEIHNRRIFQEHRDKFIIKEEKSAKKPYKRGKRKALIKMIKDWKIEWVLSYSPDRQARNMIEGWEIIELAWENLVNLKYTTFYFENNASWRMMLGFRFVFSKQYSDKLSEDIIRGKEQKIKKGKSWWDYKPWYLIDEDFYYRPHPEYFELIRKAFSLKIYERKSDEYIADRLNRNWYKRQYKNGKIWKATAKRLSELRTNEFYYGIYHRGNSTIDLTDNDLNPHYEPMITYEEHKILLDRYKGRSNFRTQKGKKPVYDEITPYEKQTVITEDWYSLSNYLPNPKRHRKNLEKRLKEDPKSTLADVVKSSQIDCKCNASQSKHTGLSIKYNVIEEAISKSLDSIKISDKMYDLYLKQIRKRINEEAEKTTKELKRLGLALNRVRTEKKDYMSRNLLSGIKLDKEENEVYQREKELFQEQINTIQRNIKELTDSERDMEFEMEYTLRLLRDAWKLFKKANYVQKRLITKLLVSNIVVSPKKQLTINYKPWLARFFWSNMEVTGVEPVSRRHIK